MSSYYYSSTFRPATRASGSPYYYGGGGGAPARPATSSVPPWPTVPIARDPIVSNPNDPTLGTLQPPYNQTPTASINLGGFQQTRPAVNFSNIDYSNDPILARTRALAEESIAQANADARAGRTRLAIGFGDPELADKLNLGGAVRKQAQENTFGTLQELNRQLDRRNVFDINAALSNQGNLFYSSERARRLSLSGETYLRDRSTAWNAVQDKLATIAQQVQAAKMAAQAQIIQAEQGAYERALQQALYAAGAG